MTMSSLHARRLIATGFLFATVGMLACEGDPPTSPDGMQIRAAKPPKDDGGEIIVKSADPPDGEQGAVGLQIRVLGSGFEKGAKVAFHLKLENGETDPDPDPGMTVQSTRFVSSTEVVATTDIALDAELSSRDISVSFRGRRGIGTEKFHVKVTGKPVEIQVDAALEDPAGTAGVFSDGMGDPDVDDAVTVGVYAGENTTARFRLKPQCIEGRSMSLEFDLSGGLNAPVPINPKTCNGGAFGDAVVFIHLADLLEVPLGGCIGQPFDLTADPVVPVGDETGVALCPFPQIPSFSFKVKGNGKLRLAAQGAFAPNAHYFVIDDTGERFDYVWQDAQVEVVQVDANTTTHRFTAAKALLYVGMQNFVCEGWDNPLDPKDISGCTVVDLPIDITVTSLKP